MLFSVAFIRVLLRLSWKRPSQEKIPERFSICTLLYWERETHTCRIFIFKSRQRGRPFSFSPIRWGRDFLELGFRESFSFPSVLFHSSRVFPPKHFWLHGLSLFLLKNMLASNPGCCGWPCVLLLSSRTPVSSGMV